MYRGTLTDPRISFEVEVQNNTTASPQTAPDGTALAPNNVWLRSTGLIDGVRIRGRFGEASARAFRPLPVFDYGIRAEGTSDQTYFLDSYDSRTGPYVPYFSPPSPGRGKVKVRSETGGDFGTWQIDGAVVVPNQSVDVTIGPNVTSGVEYEPKTFPPIQFLLPQTLAGLTPSTPPTTSGTVAPGRYTSLTTTGPLSLGPGEYSFQRLHIGDGAPGANGIVSPSNPAGGPTVIYVEESMFVSQHSQLNVGGRPEDFRVFGLDKGDWAGMEHLTLFHFEQDTSFYGVLAARNMLLYGEPEIFGACIGKLVLDPGALFGGYADLNPH